MSKGIFQHHKTLSRHGGPRGNPPSCTGGARDRDLAQDRFRDSVKTLDFHHTREHLQAVADLEHGVGSQQDREWMRNATQDLANGPHQRVVRRRQKQGRPPPLELTVTHNFGMHRCNFLSTVFA